MGSQTRRFRFLLLTAIYTALAASPLTLAAADRADADAISKFLANWKFNQPIDERFAQSSVKPIVGFGFVSRCPGIGFYVFPTVAGTPTGHVALVLNSRHEVIEVGDDAQFNRGIRECGLSVSSPADAESLARDYLRLANIHAEVWEGVKGGVRFVNGTDEIPFKTENFEHAVERLDLELNHDIRPPTVLPDQRGFVFDGFSWAPFWGDVVERKVLVHPDGTIEDHSVSIAEAYGDYKTGCVFPLDYGPSPETLARLAGRREPKAGRAVAAYLDFLASSKFILHQDLVREHRHELGEIAETLAKDPDADVAARAAEALTAMAPSHPEAP